MLLPHKINITFRFDVRRTREEYASMRITRLRMRLLEAFEEGNERSFRNEKHSINRWLKEFPHLRTIVEDIL